MTAETLTKRRVLKDGRILALNVWATGAQELVYPNEAAFLRAKAEVEQQNKPPVVGSFTPI